MRNKRRSVEQIITAAAGPEKVALALGGAVSVGAVKKWLLNGIPDWHWPTVIGLANASAEEMLQANIATRFSKRTDHEIAP
jgi:hypothetical protein